MSNSPTPSLLLLALHPAAEAAVIAVPDAKWGERPLLVVAPKPGQVRAADARRRQVCLLRA